MENNCLTIVYPTGLGGQWLLKTLASVINDNFDILNANVTAYDFYDNIPLGYGKSYHFYNAEDEIQKKLTNNVDQYLILATENSFLHYCAISKKLLFNNEFSNSVNILSKSFSEQLYECSDNARFQITDEYYQNRYRNPDKIHLNWDLIFKDPERFFKVLFTYVPDDKDRKKFENHLDFCVASAYKYQNSFNNIISCYNNYNDVAWLGWCHAIALSNNINLPINIAEFDSVTEELSQCFENISDLINQITDPFIAMWNEKT